MVNYLDTIHRVFPEVEGKEEIKEILRKTHGDIEDAKVKFLFIMEEEGFDVEVEDIETITDEPATSTFT